MTECFIISIHRKEIKAVSKLEMKSAFNATRSKDMVEVVTETILDDFTTKTSPAKDVLK